MQTSVDMVQRNDPIVYVQDACYWVKHSPDKFKRLMHLCHREVDAGNPRVTRGDIYDLAREAGFTMASAARQTRRQQVAKRSRATWSCCGQGSPSACTSARAASSATASTSQPSGTPS